MVKGNGVTPSVHYSDDMLTLWLGDALATARLLESGSVQTICTSPPYFGLRDYGHEGQMGAEQTVAGYVSGMVELFRELRRVLADDGTLWLNLGDSYSGSGKGRNGDGTASKGGKQDTNVGSQLGTVVKDTSGLPPKNLIGIPWRTAFGLQDDGWILRSDIIWAKPNPMPEPVTDRPTKAHEYLFMFAKNQRYYFDAEAIAEEIAFSSIARLAENIEAQAGSSRANGGTKRMKAAAPRFGGKKYGEDETTETKYYSGNEYVATGRRNKRDVWTVAPQGFSGAHFAVYPEALILPCILAGSKAGDTVLDPFSGSGTTGKVAIDNGRRYVGIDLNQDYLDLSLRTRFAQPSLGVEVGL